MFEKNEALLLILTLGIRFGSAIQCYDCNSVNNSMCLDPTEYDEETLNRFLPTTICGQGLIALEPRVPAYFCRKIVQTILNKGYEPEVRVTRSCGWVQHQRQCYKADNEDHLETVCQCFSDGCNGASGAKAGALLLAIALVVASKRTVPT